MSKSLFILKKREDYNSDPSYSSSYAIATGMWNSAMFVNDVLNASPGNISAIEMVDDANGIDAIVTTFNPDNVFIEGLWVTPEKFQELRAIPRHAPRNWVARVHSEIPFIAQEGIAMDWISQYLMDGVTVAPNAPRAHQQLKHLALEVGVSETVLSLKLPLLPNCYPTTFEPLAGLDTAAKTVIDIACFGAIRPLKNHLQQLFIASRFGEKIGKPVRFHINDNVSGGSDGFKRNIEDAAANLNVELVVHAWEDRPVFLQSIRDIDIMLQVSMSETFNICAADAVLVGRPILVSNEISWAYPIYGDPQRVDDCLQKLDFVWSNKLFFIQKNRARLSSFAKRAAATWREYV